MGRALGFIGLLIAVGVGAYLYTRQAQSALPQGVSSPRAAIDLTAVKNDLIALAQAERRYYTMNSKYATLDELRSNGDTNVADSRGPYAYSVEMQDNKFVVKATYNGSDAAMPRTVTVDQTMQIRNE